MPHLNGRLGGCAGGQPGNAIGQDRIGCEQSKPLHQTRSHMSGDKGGCLMPATYKHGLSGAALLTLQPADTAELAVLLITHEWLARCCSTVLSLADIAKPSQRTI